MIDLAQGTIENLIVDIEDRKSNLETIEGTAPKFSVRPRFGDNESWIIEDQSATPEGLRAFCLIDTTDSELWPTGEYEIYVKFENLPETPKLGPMHFEVI